MTFYLLLTFCTFLASLLGTRMAIMAARRRTMPIGLDGRPKRKIPTGGGVILVVTLAIGLLFVHIPYPIIFAMLLITAVALLSDLITIPPLINRLIYFLAILIALHQLDQTTFTTAFGELLPLWLDKLFMTALWLWCIHVFEVMDDIDGITTTQTICMATSLSLLVSINGGFPNQLSLYGIVIMSAGCGFFWWNWYPAKIRLGHAGTAALGFLMGYLLMLAIASGYGYAAIILPAYYFCDAGFTFLHRFVNQKPLFVPHHDYYYQRAVLSGRSHDTVVRYIFGNNFLLSLLATFSVLFPTLGILCLIAAYSITLVMLRFFAFAPHDPQNEPF